MFTIPVILNNLYSHTYNDILCVLNIVNDLYRHLLC